jgi:hypothetical protein
LTDLAGVEDTTYFISPASTPYAAAMASSNLASRSGDTYTYFEKDASGFYLRGIVFPLPALPISLPFQAAPLRLNNRIPILTFPATNGMDLKSQATARFEFDFDTTIGIFIISKVAIVLTLRDTSIIDGYGTGTFNSEVIPCLRNIHSTRSSFKIQMFATFNSLLPPFWTDVPTAILPPFPDQVSSDILVWAKNKKGPVATFNLNEEGNLSGASIQSPLLVTGLNSFVSSPTFEWNPYPNPAKNLVSWNESDPIKNLKIFSADGRIIANIYIENNQNGINLGEIQNGLYWIEATNSKGNLSRKKLIINR